MGGGYAAHYIQKISIIFIIMNMMSFVHATCIVLDLFARYSFTIYFLHLFVANSLASLFLHLKIFLNMNEVLRMIVVVFCFVFLTLLVSVFLKFITGKLSRYLIGS